VWKRGVCVFFFKYFVSYFSLVFVRCKREKYYVRLDDRWSIVFTMTNNNNTRGY